jgi:hypothetical protein
MLSGKQPRGVAMSLSDATYISELNKLENPKKYINAAAKRMRECQKENGDARVFIGLKASKRPSFLVKFNDDKEFGRFGAAGTRFKDADDPEKGWPAGEQFWSKRFSTLPEIEALIEFMGWGS